MTRCAEESAFRPLANSAPAVSHRSRMRNPSIDAFIVYTGFEMPFRSRPRLFIAW